MDKERLVSLEGLANSGSGQLRGCGQMELIGDMRMLMLETKEPSAVCSLFNPSPPPDQEFKPVFHTVAAQIRRGQCMKKLESGNTQVLSGVHRGEDSRELISLGW